MVTQTTRRSTPSRKPGRPPAGGIDQRERLLDSALQSFADHGIAATSLRQLAQEGGLTPAMLNYYFGSRDRLVDAVVEERLLPVMTELRDRLNEASDKNAAAAARTFVGALHAAIVQHPWLPALWVREVLPENGALRSVLSERIAPEIALPLAQRFAAGQREGQINPALEPRLLFVSLIGLTMLPFAAQHLWRRTFSADDVDAGRMLEHTLALLGGGIES